jgi:CHASE2 domain-containing sensor protein
MTKRQTPWAALRREWRIWKAGALPGLAVIGLVTLLRLTGSLQVLELLALDALLRLRPAEPNDPHILIVGIDEDDIQAIGQYPIPDEQLAALIRRLQQAEPTAIALDLYRDLPQEPGSADLSALFRSQPNLFGIEKIIGRAIAPPPGLPPEQIGFADLPIDLDGRLRRSALGSYNADKTEFRLSLAQRLAERFLSERGVSLESGLRDPYAMRFGPAELPRTRPNTGSYRQLQPLEVETLLFFRSGNRPFEIVSLREVLSGQVSAEKVRDRIVLIGMVAPSVPDTFNSMAAATSVPAIPVGTIAGVEAHAHATSQIIQAALYGRPLLRGWAEPWEYGWLVLWGILGIGLGRFLVSPVRILAGLGLGLMILLGFCFLLLVAGWWVPLVPALLAFFLNGVGLTAALFYRHQQDLKLQLRDRQYVIDHTFNAIHSGPLQTLSRLLSKTRSGHLPESQWETELEQLNRELRVVYDSVRKEILTEDGSLYLSEDQALDLNGPFEEALYEVYDHTLRRDFDCFKTLKRRLITFEPLETSGLTLEHKRELCRFLEETLCNVGKYAIGVTQLNVVCKQEDGNNLIRVIDNGKGIDPEKPVKPSALGGRGTQIAESIANQLGGKFRREPITPHGTLCELKWNPSKIRFWT